MKRFVFLLLLLLAAGSGADAAGEDVYTFLPYIARPPVSEEVRGLWVTRFDWTNYGVPADPARIDDIVSKAAMAGFNTIYFQVRGVADAYYTPGLEPWAQRVSGSSLGEPPDPYWDPLAYFVQEAHAQDIQLHAYLNVYPTWDDCEDPPPQVTPTHLYYLLEAEHGTTDGKLNGMQWNTDGNLACGVYQRATPASIFMDDHLVAVATDLVSRYDIDGLHLDHIRYAGGNTSCDPVSLARTGVTCFTSPPPGYGSYEAWQRRQVSGTVQRIYNDVVLQNEDIWLSAAVWPIYQDYWGWGVNTGYGYYYQDSKAWLAGGYIDSISPMIYGASGFWTLDRWRTLAANFQADNAGRYVVPGIGAETDDFGEILARIEYARELGTAGHALFSFGAMNNHGYFDDLAAGPYATPAVPPPIPWHP